MNKTIYTNYHRDKDYFENEDLFRNIFLKRYKIINKFVENSGKVLEIGCSNGVFLDIFKNSGWETFGVEPSESGYLAEKKGHKIFHSYFEKIKFENNYFDLIVMNHTLEHVDDAGLVLAKIYQVLKKNGILFLDVPNAGSLSSKILGRYWPYRLPQEHNYQFTKQSLSRFLQNARFKVLFWTSRSGLFDFDCPLLEVWESLTRLKKRFFTDIIGLPYAALATLIKMGDSMSFVAKKV